MDIIYLALVGLGIFIVVYLSLTGILSFLERVKPGNRIKELYFLFDMFIRKSPKVMGFRITVPYILAAVCLSVLGVTFGITWLHNLTAAAFLLVFGIAFPQLIMLQRVANRQEKIMEQLGTAVRIFTAEYSDTPHTLRAIGRSAQRLPEPIGTIFRHAEQEYLAGEDPYKIINRMANNIGSDYGRMFGHLLETSIHDEAVKPLFSQLAVRITGQQEAFRKNRQEITKDRISIGVLNGAMIPTFLIVNKLIPESQKFFTQSGFGKGVVVFCLLSLMVGIVLDLFATRSAVYD